MIKSIASPFQTPVTPHLLCVILDGSFDPDLPTHVDQAIRSGAERCIPLLDDTPYAALQPAGPFALLCPASGPLMTYVSALLERADAGCVAYLNDEQSFRRAITHWRSLLTVSTEESSAQMLRFFEPRWMEALLNSLDDSERLSFMGPVTDLAWRNELGWRHLANPQPDPDVEVLEPGWLHLSQERLTLMGQYRLKVVAERLAQDYQAALPADEPVEFVYRQLLAAEQIGYQQLPEQERWLRLALSQDDGFWNSASPAEVLARNDLSLGEKLAALERL